MRNRIFISLLVASLLVPALVLAGGEHSPQKANDHLGMSTAGKMIMLGAQEVDGVKGMAHLNDVRVQMAAHGMKQTHHIMIVFDDVASGEPIETGKVAVIIEDPDENVSDAVQLMAMDGHFGADITLDKKGLYHFKIGTELADGQKRMFHLHFENR